MSTIKFLGETIHITLEYLSQEAKASSAKSKVKGMEVELSKLKKDLILAMDEANTAKEKAKVLSDDLRAEKQLTLEKDEQLQAAREQVKAIAVKFVETFQQTDEYNTMLFSRYYKGLGSYCDISSNTLLTWTGRTWNSRPWTKRWLRTRLPRLLRLLKLLLLLSREMF